MDGLRKALRSDLGRHFTGELLTDPLTLAVYSTDASLFQIDPLAIACPANEADLSLLIQTADASGLSLIARGAGTGMAGESLGSGIVVDFGRSMREILEVGDDFIRVQPGARIGDVARRLRSQARRIESCRNESDSATIGGWASVQRSRDIIGGRFIFDSGEVIDSSDHHANNPRWNEIVAGLGQLAKTHETELRSYRRPHAEDRCGYDIRIKIAGTEIDPFALLLGSEGTLGLISELKIKTVRLPLVLVGLIFGCDSLEAAVQVGRLCAAGADSTTILDRRSLAWIRKSSPEWDRLLPTDCEAVAMVETSGDQLELLRESARQRIDQIQKQRQLASWVFPAFELPELERWLILDSELKRGFASPAIGSRPLAIMNDMAVDPAELSKWIPEVQKILRELDCTATLQIDVGVGHIDLRPILDFGNEEDRSKLWPLADRLYSLVIGMGGTISSRQGIGLARTPWVEKQTGQMQPIYQEIKRIFDPRNLFNPGKFVGLDPNRPAWPLRPLPSIQLPEGKIALELADACHGCGDCQTTSMFERTCPPYRVDRKEIGSPRGMMNALQYLGRQPAEAKVDGTELAEIAEGCNQCQQCKSGCSAGIDIPRLMLETRIAAVQENGLTWSEWFMSRSDRWLQWGCRLPGPTNRLLRNSFTRRLLQWLTGLARDVQFPRKIFGERPFHCQHQMVESSVATEKPVLLWVGSAANYLNPRLARATVEVLEHNGIAVEVPAKPTPSLAAPLFLGDVSYAVKLLKPHLPAMAAMVRKKGSIVCLEPSDATILRDHPNLLYPEEPERIRISTGTYELTDYLNGLHKTGQLLSVYNPAPTEVIYHMPCHRKSGSKSRIPVWLNEIPELMVDDIEKGCSGMAGTFGLQKANRRASKAIGEPLREILQMSSKSLSVSECSACRLQMRQFNGQPALHPVELLHRAYFPERGDHLK